MKGRMTYLGLWLVMSFSLAWLSSCGPIERGEEKKDQVPEEVSYSNDVYPILNSKCSSCHGQGGPASSTRFKLTGDANQDYEVIKSLIDTQNPEESQLLQKGGGKIAHGGGAALSSDEYNTVKAWIQKGAQKN